MIDIEYHECTAKGHEHLPLPLVRGTYGKIVFDCICSIFKFKIQLPRQNLHNFSCNNINTIDIG